MAPGKKKKTKEAKIKDALKKSRAHSKLAGREGKEQHQDAEVQVDSCSEPPADEVPYIQAFWDVLSEQQRQQLLTVGVGELQQTASELTEAVSHHSLCSLQHAMLLSQDKRLSDVIEQGMRHLWACRTSESSLRTWCWPNVYQAFVEEGSFREYVKANHIDQQLLEFLPKGEAVAAEAEAVWIRMEALSQRVCTLENTFKDAGPGEHIPFRPMKLITTILAAFEEEQHVYLYQFILFPVISAVFKALPKSERATTATNLSYCDLGKLPRHILLHICYWLKAGVEMLSKLKSKSNGGHNWLDKEGLIANTSVTRGGHKFCLPPRNSSQVQVDPFWYKYLKELQPVCEGTDNIDYRLQWVLGLVYDHDSYQSWNRIPVGDWVPTVQHAHQLLVSMLRDMKAWQTRAEESKRLLQEMLVSRQGLAEIKLQHDVSPRPDREKNKHPCELPDHVVVALLKREALLVNVRMHTVKIQRIMDKEHLSHLQAKQNQGEPEFNRWDAILKAEHAEIQSGRSGAKAHLNLVTDESGLAERFESLGATLRAYEAKEREVRLQIVHHDAEIKQFTGWSENSMKMATSIETMASATAQPVIEGLQEGALCPCCNSTSCTGLAAGRKVAMQVHEEQAQQLRDTAAMLKQAFQTDVRYQLHDEAQDQRLYKLAQKQLKQIEKRQLQGQAVLPLLENSVINLACDDPGAVMGPLLILPTLRKRLLDKAHEFHQAEAIRDRVQKTTQQEAAALLASQELLAEEEREQARAAAKKAKKDRAKAKSGGKLAASQNSVQEQPPLQPDSHVGSPSAHALKEAEQQHKYDELFTSPTSAGDGSLSDGPAASAQSAVETDPSNTSSGTTSMGPTNEAGWDQTGKKGSVLAARLSEAPAMVTESVNFEPSPPNGSSGLAAQSSGLAAQSSGLAAQSSGLATESSSSSICLGSSTLEQTVVHLMMCPLTQAVMKDPVIAADGHTYERGAMQKWLQRHQTSPITGKALMHVRLVPNIVIRSVIQQQLL